MPGVSSNNLKLNNMEDKIKYDGKSPLEKGTLIFIGRFHQFKLEVQEDLGQSVSVINLNKNYKKDPYVIEKNQIKNCKILKN
jgi:hypothetical protein